MARLEREAWNRRCFEAKLTVFVLLVYESLDTLFDEVLERDPTSDQAFQAIQVEPPFSNSTEHLGVYPVEREHT